MRLAGLFSAQQSFAKTVAVTMTAKEVDLPVNGKLVGGADTMAAWTFDGSIPGKPVRVKLQLGDSEIYSFGFSE